MMLNVNHKIYKFNLESQLTFMIQESDTQHQQSSPQKLLNYPSQIQYPFIQSSYQNNNLNESQFIGFKLLTGFTSVIVSEFLLANTLSKWIFGFIYDKRYTATLFKPEASEKVKWVNAQTKTFMKSSIRYNSIIFGSKVILDQHYAQTIKQNETYYESNSTLHYKIGSMIGFIVYTTSIPFVQFENAKTLTKVQTNFSIDKSPKPNNYIQRLRVTWGQFLTAESFRKMINAFNLTNLAGAMMYRTIYFGSYENLKSKNNHPANEYLIAPIGCSALALIVTPIDQIRYLQMTTHKDKSIFQIMSEKGIKLWNLSGQKIYYSMVKQSVSMSIFVAGQNLCKYISGLKNSE